jgi:hypothetical protein
MRNPVCRNDPGSAVAVEARISLPQAAIRYSSSTHDLSLAEITVARGQ